MTADLNAKLNTHALDDKYLEIVCCAYKCPFRLTFEQCQINRLKPKDSNKWVTTHSKSRHEAEELNDDSELEL